LNEKAKRARGTDYRCAATGVRFGSQADMCGAKRHVRSYSKSGHVRCTGSCPLWAKSRRNKRRRAALADTRR